MERKWRELVGRLFENRIRRMLALILAIIVTFTTTYALVLPAITLEKDTSETMSGVSMGGNEQKGDTSSPSRKEGADESGSADSKRDTVAFDAEAKNEAGETEALVHASCWTRLRMKRRSRTPTPRRRSSILRKKSLN